MKRPNFFILGAPKCGTTSVANWLGEHPQVFMSKVKEPHFFDTDQPGGVQVLSEYERLFRHAAGSHVVVGEASVRYLHSRIAVDRILEYSPQAKFLVMVRNPMEMAPSLHEQKVFGLQDDVQSFAEAWALQDQRRRGLSVPTFCDDPAGLQYGDYCLLGEQLARVLERTNNVKIVFTEDLRSDSRGVYLSVLNFLDIEDDQRTRFPAANSAKTWKHKSVAHLIRIAVKAKRTMAPRIPQLGIASRMSEWNRTERPRNPLPEDLKADMEAFFSDDIKVLASLTGRNLSHWRSSAFC